ncbi:MAG: hypothetical protein HYZ16_06320 [Bacteroidetes bacterium]|jgi:DNA polymerase-3 subunit delta'|nr:hypothetical protein [Bacteroidota bacterium]
MQFKDVVGQQRIKDKLVEGVRAGKVHHAQLFLGDTGHGSLALALAYAQYLNCQDPGPMDSCGQCGNCQKNYKLIHPDVHFSFPIVATKSANDDQDPKTGFYGQWRELIQETAYPSYNEWIKKIGQGEKQGNIPISEARSIIRKLSLKSHQGGYKVLIMWLPEFLGKEGNVLLKVLEEPSPATLFVLVAEDESQILTTILSRCQVIRIPRIAPADIAQSLEQVFATPPERATQTAALSEGSFRRAIEILQSGEDAFFVNFTKWVRLTFAHDYAALHNWSNETSGMGKENIKNFLIYSLGIFRECMLMKTGIHSLTKLVGQELEWVRDKFSPNIAESGLVPIVQLINQAHYHITRNANVKVVLFDLSLQISKYLR